jgi:flagellin
MRPPAENPPAGEARRFIPEWKDYPMANSVNTNVGALVALQNLNATNAELATTQTRINTGKKVASAKDNGAIFAIAQNQRATSNALNSVVSSLERNQSAVEVAISAGETISDVLVQLKEKALAARDSGLDTASRTALNDEFKTLLGQITKAVTNADFNGSNLIKQAGTTVKALANADATSVITVQAQTLTLSALSINTNTLGTTAAASLAIAAVNAAITEVSSKLSSLGTGAKALGNHLTFVKKLQDTIDAGVGNLVDADLAKESAKLQALQTKQQLGVQALSIANQSSSILLGLFR